MGIQQQVHAVPVQKASGSSSSKSSLTQIAPACNPATRGMLDEAIGTTRASGVAPSVRIISVPIRTRDKRSCKFVGVCRKSTVFSCMDWPPMSGIVARKTTDAKNEVGVCRSLEPRKFLRVQLKASRPSLQPGLLHESVFLGVAGELCAAIDAELLIDVVEMDLDRSLADEEFLADLHIAQPGRHLFDDFDFSG